MMPARRIVLLVIDVVQEAGSARARAARSPRFELRPLVGGNDARDEVERNQPLGARPRSPYTANVMPTRWKMRSASPRFCAMRSGGVRSSQSANAR